MVDTPHLLLLAGSAEGRALATGLAGRDFRVTASLAVPRHWSGPLAVPTRTGGFGGEEGFVAFLRREKVTAVLDATHPFATHMSLRSWNICQAQDIPFLQILRPCWTPRTQDQWREVGSARDATALIPPGARVFVTTGRETLPDFVQNQDCRFFFRHLVDDPVDCDIKNVSYVTGKGPFSVDEEIATLRGLQIDLLICKNAGGELSRTKLDAARALDIPVILLRRPPPIGAPVVQTVENALEWVDRTCL